MCSLPAPTHVGNLKQAVAKTKAAATVMRHVEPGQHRVGPHQWALTTMHLAGQQASIFEGHCHGKLTTPILGMTVITLCIALFYRDPWVKFLFGLKNSCCPNLGYFTIWALVISFLPGC